jgi:hypothetical protein
MISQSSLVWKKSSYSGANGNCVEVARIPAGGFAARDSKLAADSPVLSFGTAAWDVFVQAVKSGAHGAR